ncbi:acetyl-CoA hydrolase/transferase family protein [Rhodoferax ferrireducens]|uniref:acetyl-CoA hydrolase/transferase family protein n=1 Tax=Rhodoferax ferrireducens TaxID=192843 RepID=UPI000E0DE775|nr:acetyl-CoA hydrolase/transferase C-terminal domain-containing protein [Rhodoferax ferrireducens]
MSHPLQRLSDAIKPGNRVFVSTMSAESALLAEELRGDPERARDVNFMGVQFPGIDTIDYLSLHPESRLAAFFMSPAVRSGLKEGRAALHGVDYLGIAHTLRHGPPVDLAIAQVSPPDAQGRCSIGLSSDFLPLVWNRAKQRIAHINPLMPRTQGSFSVNMSELDGWVEAERPLLTYKEPVMGEIDLRIAAQAASLVRDGDTLQFGMGTVPLALGQALSQHRRLKIHAGMVTQVVQRLHEAGALDPDARITTGVALGDTRFYDFVAQHENLWFTDVSQTHNVAAIARIPRFVAVNAAVEVDLFGQVNSERMGGVLQAGAGGLPAFAQGALNSEGGRLLICLRATAARGAISRIVPALDAQALCTLPGYMADAVITEHGIAELRGRSMEQRAQALIGIAEPSHRAALLAAWEQQRARL